MGDVTGCRQGQDGGQACEGPVHPTGRLDFVFYPPTGQEARDGFGDGSGMIQLACRRSLWQQTGAGTRVELRLASSAYCCHTFRPVEPRGDILFPY